MKHRLLLLAIILLANLSALAQDCIVTGTVYDEQKAFLAGATVRLQGTNRGTVVDANGHYTISVPIGESTLQFSFIGYKTKTEKVVLKNEKTFKLDVTLQPTDIMGQEVIISVQAKGQTAAINKQLNSNAIMNVVSGEKLSELPDANVADAIGRLPGLMVQRDGGEGQKIMIRGLDPKYNSVAMNGMSAPSTSTTDRSTDLNMISPEMVGSAEVMKANTADMDADGLGGTVNLVMKDAPKGMRLRVTGEGGYHSQINGFGHIKGNVLASNRFFNDKLGVIFNASAERTDRSNDRSLATYKVNGNTPTEGLNYTKPWITTTRLQNNLEKRDRFNVNLNIDYKFGSGNTIKLYNLYSALNRKRDIREKRYDLEGGRLRYIQTDAKPKGYNFSNMIEGEHNFWGSTLSWGGGISQSVEKTNYEHRLEFRENNPFLVDIDALGQLPPSFISAPEYVDEADRNQYYLYDGTFNLEHTKETEYSAWLNWKKNFGSSDIFNGFIKVGIKYRQKDRKRSTDRNYRRLDLYPDSVFANMQNLEPSGFDSRYVGIGSFIDNDFKPKDFLANRYDNLHFDFALNKDVMRNFYNLNSSLYRPILTTKIQKDYEGHEENMAAYIMGEFNITKYITFIPGVRFDHTWLRYKAYSGTNVPDDETQELNFDFTQTSDHKSTNYLLPQIHLRIKPLNCLDVRLAYTETLSRPDYDILAPRTIIKPNTAEVTYNRTNLKPALSKNFDAIVTFYKPNIGLFTIGGFYKRIKNFIYTRSAYILDGTNTDPSVFGLASSLVGYGITYPVNSPYKATIKGIEFDTQTQLRSLPGLWKGIVISANMTLMSSRMGYFETIKSRVKNPNYVTGGSEKPFVPINKDTVYYDRVLTQPSLLANIAIGYDYKGFSGRLSYTYQGDILTSEQHRADGADVEQTRDFQKWDFQLRQRINRHFSIYFSASNIFNWSDSRERKVTGYPSNVEIYGSTFYLGVKYDVF